MFTGIIEGKGVVKKVESFPAHHRLEIQSSFSLRGTKVGDSIAVDGCCLTVTKVKGNRFIADLSPETLQRTTLPQLQAGQAVNLELPLRLHDRLGGHLVQGHVDGVGKILSKELIAAEPSSYYVITIEVPPTLLAYMIEKGSIAIDGISLTINSVKKNRISLCIIPHTQKKTTLIAKKPGTSVNLEADILLKYIEQMLRVSRFNKGKV